MEDFTNFDTEDLEETPAAMGVQRVLSLRAKRPLHEDKIQLTDRETSASSLFSQEEEAILSKKAMFPAKTW
jgi:hypothetical protein